MPTEAGDMPASVAVWRQQVEEQFTAGARRMSDLSKKLAENTKETTEAKEAANEAKQATHALSERVDAHMEQMRPVVTAVETMESGIRVLGKIGDAIAWCGRWIRKIVVWVAPMVAFVVGVWTFMKTGHWRGE